MAADFSTVDTHIYPGTDNPETMALRRHSMAADFSTVDTHIQSGNQHS